MSKENDDFKKACILFIHKPVNKEPEVVLFDQDTKNMIIAKILSNKHMKNKKDFIKR